MRWQNRSPYHHSKGGHFAITERVNVGGVILEGGEYKGEFTTLKEAKDFVKVNMKRWKSILKDEGEI